MDHEIKQFERVERLIQELTEGDDPYPQIIEIHPTDICNHKCIYCFRRNHRYEPSKKKEVLGLEHYQSLFEEMLLSMSSTVVLIGFLFGLASPLLWVLLQG